MTNGGKVDLHFLIYFQFQRRSWVFFFTVFCFVKTNLVNTPRCDLTPGYEEFTTQLPELILLAFRKSTHAIQ